VKALLVLVSAYESMVAGSLFEHDLQERARMAENR
jgi:hypothetical protein